MIPLTWDARRTAWIYFIIMIPFTIAVLGIVVGVWRYLDKDLGVEDEKQLKNRAMKTGENGEAQPSHGDVEAGRPAT